MADRHSVCVLAPILTLTITIEPTGEDGPDDIHIHPGGQGFWIARMLRHLGERPLLCAPVGGEPGRVLRALVPEWGIDLSPVQIEDRSPGYVHDRRSGERNPLAETPTPTPGRHEMDDLYGKVLDHSLSAGATVISGNGEMLPVDFYRRLGSDLAAAETTVVGDLHGPELEAYLEGGPLDILKVSDEDLAADGALADRSESAALAVIERLRERGAQDVVVSRGRRPTLASIGGTEYRVTTPELEVVDHRGAGDSMTAGLMTARLRGESPEGSLRLAAAAGAANVTRHGLGSASPDLIDRLAERVEVTTLSPTVS